MTAITITIKTRTLAQVRARGTNAGITGGPSGWLRDCALGRVQGWSQLRTVAIRRVERAERAGTLPPNLAEILDGTRIGVPTLSIASSLELAVGLLAPGPVAWRP